MKVIIHGTYPDGTEDSINIAGDSIAEIRKLAKEESEKRRWTNCWSETLEE